MSLLCQLRVGCKISTHIGLESTYSVEIKVTWRLRKIEVDVQIERTVNIAIVLQSEESRMVVDDTQGTCNLEIGIDGRITLSEYCMFKVKRNQSTSAIAVGVALQTRISLVIEVRDVVIVVANLLYDA